MMLGDLYTEEVDGIRTGTVSDPTVGQMAVLACAFGVEPYYLTDRDEPVSVGELVEVLRDGPQGGPRDAAAV